MMKALWITRSSYLINYETIHRSMLSKRINRLSIFNLKNNQDKMHLPPISFSTKCNEQVDKICNLNNEVIEVSTNSELNEFETKINSMNRPGSAFLNLYKTHQLDYKIEKERIDRIIPKIIRQLQIEDKHEGVIAFYKQLRYNKIGIQSNSRHLISQSYRKAFPPKERIHVLNELNAKGRDAKTAENINPISKVSLQDMNASDKLKTKNNYHDTDINRVKNDTKKAKILEKTTKKNNKTIDKTYKNYFNEFQNLQNVEQVIERFNEIKHTIVNSGSRQNMIKLYNDILRYFSSRGDMENCFMYYEEIKNTLESLNRSISPSNLDPRYSHKAIKIYYVMKSILKCEPEPINYAQARWKAIGFAGLLSTTTIGFSIGLYATSPKTFFLSAVTISSIVFLTAIKRKKIFRNLETQKEIDCNRLEHNYETMKLDKPTGFNKLVTNYFLRKNEEKHMSKAMYLLSQMDYYEIPLNPAIATCFARLCLKERHPDLVKMILQQESKIKIKNSQNVNDLESIANFPIQNPQLICQLIESLLLQGYNKIGEELFQYAWMSDMFSKWFQTESIIPNKMFKLKYDLQSFSTSPTILLELIKIIIKKNSKEKIKIDNVKEIYFIVNKPYDILDLLDANEPTIRSMFHLADIRMIKKDLYHLPMDSKHIYL